MDVPRWAAYRGARPAPVPWSELGYRLLLPMYDAMGTLQSVRARAVTPSGRGSRYFTPGVIGIRARDPVRHDRAIPSV